MRRISGSNVRTRRVRSRDTFNTYRRRYTENREKMFVSKKILHQTLACSPVLCLQILFGTFSGWMLPTMAKLKDPNSELYVADTGQVSWFASIQDVGRVMGPFVSPLLVDKLGRKCTLVLVAAIYFVVWSSLIFVRNIYPLCALRFLFGLGNGVNDVVSGIYTTENCSPSFRGIIGSIVLLTHFLAIFIECVIAAYLSTLTTAVINTLLAGCALVNTLCCGVETPSFLITRGEREKAERNLIWLSGGDDGDKTTTEDDLRKIEQSMAEERLKKRSVRELLSSTANVKRIVLVVGMNALFTATGASAFNNYASVIFQPCETFATRDFVVLYGAMPLIGVSVAPFIIERVNRRSMVIAGTLGVTLCNISSFFLTYSRGRGHGIVAYPWLIFASISSVSVCIALMAPAAYALKGELLPYSVRTIGSSMAVVSFSAVSFTVNRTFLPIAQRFGQETNFLVFSVVGLFSTLFFYYCLPETRGKTLVELQNVQQRSEQAQTSDTEGSCAAGV